MSFLNEILIAMGSNATLLIVLAYLARSLMQTLLAKDIKKFEVELQNNATAQLERLKSDLRSAGDVSIEQLKSRLQQAAIEHQVRFSNLHEQRAQKIADLYRRIVEQSLACQRYVFRLTAANRQVGFLELEKSFSDFFLFFESSRIYLPEHVCGLLEKLSDTIRQPAISVYVYGDTDDHANDAVREEKRRAFKSAFQALDAEIPAAKKILEDEFRRLLGAEAVG